MAVDVPVANCRLLVFAVAATSISRALVPRHALLPVQADKQWARKFFNLLTDLQNVLHAAQRLSEHGDQSSCNPPGSVHREVFCIRRFQFRYRNQARNTYGQT